MRVAALAIVALAGLCGCAGLPVQIVPPRCAECATLTPDQLRELARKLYDAGYKAGVSGHDRT